MVDSPRPKSTLQTVVLLGVFGLSVLLACAFLLSLQSSPGIDAKKARAQLGCTNLAQAIETYVDHPSNARRELPLALSDLHQPSWGGASLLKYGSESLLDPWGEPYLMERRRFSDGTEYILVKTTAPGGLPISQFGIGSATQPKE